MGDIHGEWGKMNTLINKKKPTIVFQCGDLGYFPKWQGKFYTDSMGNRRQFKSEPNVGSTKVYWCGGNHEDWDSLDALENNEIWPNVFYMKRNSVLTLNDGRNVLFIGGALSIDKAWRTPGDSWFAQETISQKDIFELPDVQVDIVISHTAPQSFPCVDEKVEFEHDCSRDALDYVLQKYHPKLWYFGHFHARQSGIYEGCKWHMLDDTTGSKWWCWL